MAASGLNGVTSRATSRQRTDEGHERFAEPVRHRSGQDSRQLCGADAAQFSGAHRGCLSGSCQHGLRRPQLYLVADFCALPAICVLSCRPEHRPWRYRRGDAAEHPRHERTAFCRADGRRRAQRAQHPARCAFDRVPARSRRRQNHPGRSGIFRRDRGSADADEGPKALCHRRRRCGLRRRKADRRARI